jgi:membrane-bound ClpP family serine protease
MPGNMLLSGDSTRYFVYMTLIHAVLMIVVFLLLLALELFIPSGGLLGIAAAAALIAAIVIGFLHSLTAGATILIGAAIGVPFLVSIGLRIWPKTPMGRRMLTIDPVADAIREAEFRAEREAIVGKTGVAKTNMLPSGLVEIEGVRMDAVSVGMAIDSGQKVEVVSVSSGKIHVRPIDSEHVTSTRPAIPDSLETPIDSLGIEDF